MAIVCDPRGGCVGKLYFPFAFSTARASACEQKRSATIAGKGVRACERICWPRAPAAEQSRPSKIKGTLVKRTAAFGQRTS
eukprot:4273164-Alexandrium_andersonii.AAC.1